MSKSAAVAFVLLAVVALFHLATRTSKFEAEDDALKCWSPLGLEVCEDKAPMNLIWSCFYFKNQTTEKGGCSFLTEEQRQEDCLIVKYTPSVVCSCCTSLCNEPTKVKYGY